MESAEIEKAQCVVCRQPHSFRWTDTHGIAACSHCGMPYVLLRHDAENRRLHEPPSPALNEEGVEVARRYWAERKARVFPAYYDIGILSHGTSHSGATLAEVRAFNDWYDANHTQHFDNAGASA